MVRRGRVPARRLGRQGTSTGKIDPAGNIFEAPRSRGYPNKPLRRSGWNDLTLPGRKGHRGASVPGADGHPLGSISRVCRVHLLRLLRLDRMLDGREGVDESPFHPAGRRDREPQDRGSRASARGQRRQGRKGQWRDLPEGRSEYFQPAKVVVLSSYIYENTRLLLLSTSKAYPHGLSNNHGQVGKNYMGHGLASASVMGVFKGQKLNLYSGTIGQYTAVDNWDADNFDHSGLGFISGGMVSATMESKPINGTANTTPPSVPTWGSAYKAWLAENYDAVGTISAQVETFSYPQNYCDLDPVVKDDLGRPVLRITFALQQNEIVPPCTCRRRSRRGWRRLGRRTSGRSRPSSIRRARTRMARRAWAPIRRRPCSTSGRSRTRCRTCSFSAARRSRRRPGAIRPSRSRRHRGGPATTSPRTSTRSRAEESWAMVEHITRSPDAVPILEADVGAPSVPRRGLCLICGSWLEVGRGSGRVCGHARTRGR